MANFDTIRTAIDANIKTNGTQDITGGKMNSILHQMVDATDEQLTELESNFNRLSYNKLNLYTLKKGYFISNDLNEYASNDFAITDFIPFKSGSLCWSVNGVKPTQYGTDIWGHILYNENKEPIKYVGINQSKGVAIWEEGVAYVRFDIYKYNEGNHLINIGNEVGEYSEFLSKLDSSLIDNIRITPLTDEGDIIAEIIDNGQKKFIRNKNGDIVNALYKTNVESISEFPQTGFLGKNGNINSTQPEWSCTDFIRLDNTEYLDIKGYFGNPYGGGVAFYNASKEFISSIHIADTEGTQTKRVTIPSNAIFAIVCTLTSDIAQSYIKIYSISGIVKDLESRLSSNAPFLQNQAESMANNNELKIFGTPNVKTWHTYHVFAMVSTFGAIEICHSRELYSYGIIQVDSTNVYQLNTDGTIAFTYPHRLDIKDFIHIIIDVKDDIYHADVTVLTNENKSFRVENVYWHGCQNDAYIKYYGSSIITNVIFTISGSAWNKNVWFFGDSYADFWASKIKEVYNATNFMVDAYSGRDSENALKSLKFDLQIGKPKIIVWMLGMNDADSNEGINQNYKSVLDDVINICKNLGIRLIIATIPNTPTELHTYKNEYVKKSKCEILDVAKMFNAENAGSSWFNGLLGADNVHPSQPNGAIALATMLYASLSEIH